VSCIFFRAFKMAVLPFTFLCVVNIFPGVSFVVYSILHIHIQSCLLYSPSQHSSTYSPLCRCSFPRSIKQIPSHRQTNKSARRHTPCSVTIKLLPLTMALLGLHLSPLHHCQRRNLSSPVQCRATDTCSSSRVQLAVARVRSRNTWPMNSNFRTSRAMR
jgi:hypothetical protein